MVDLDLFRLETKRHDGVDYGSYRPTLHDVSRWFDNIENAVKGGRLSLVGERESALTAFAAYVLRKKSVYIRSYAGSGKTMIAEAVVSTIPHYLLYQIDNSSDKAIWYEEDSINASNYVYIGELQKVKADTVEALKSWGEGRAATRTVPDLMASQRNGRPTSRTTHLDVKPTLVTQAFENKDASAINDEFLRRVFDLRTDPSSGQTRRVKMSKLERRANPWADRGLPDADVGQLRAHVENAILLPVKGFAMPGIDADAGFESYIPEEYVISRSYVDHFLDLAEGIGAFYHYDRITHEDHLLVAPADLFAAVVLQGPQLRLSCFRLDEEDMAIMQALPPIKVGPDGELRATKREKRTESQVMATLSSMGLNLERGKVRERLVKLSMMTAYVEVDRETTPHRYYRSPGVSGSFEAEVDWTRVVDDMAKGAKRVLPPEVADEYVRRFCGPRAEAVDPLTGEVVDLRTLKRPEAKPNEPSNASATGIIVDHTGADAPRAGTLLAYDS